MEMVDAIELNGSYWSTAGRRTPSRRRQVDNSTEPSPRAAKKSRTAPAPADAPSRQGNGQLAFSAARNTHEARKPHGSKPSLGSPSNRAGSTGKMEPDGCDREGSVVRKTSRIPNVAVMSERCDEQVRCPCVAEQECVASG